MSHTRFPTDNPAVVTCGLPYANSLHVSSPDAGDQQHAMINAANLLADESVYSAGNEVVVLANGAAVRMFIEGTADHPDMVERLFDDGVSLRACGNALASMDATDDDLLAGVEIVPSGSDELARLEDEGFGYIKAP